MGKTSIIVCGAGGKMGRLIIDLAKNSSDFELKAGIETDQKLKEETLLKGVYLGDTLSDFMCQRDVVIDFTEPKATVKFVGECVKKGVPIVVGTTGLTKEDYAVLLEASKVIPLFYAPNMSFGVNLFFEMIQVAASLMKEYDVEVSEIHHHFKKDAPSGTAKKIAEIICEASGRKFEQVIKYGREGIEGPRSKEEICVHSLRMGDVVGEHYVYFGGQGEVMEFSHRCYNRESFASGALKAARFIDGKKPGLYNMKNLIDELKK
jgi:4-hydroxy-tetrahydrodipicolinate reductase